MEMAISSYHWRCVLSKCQLCWISSIYINPGWFARRVTVVVFYVCIYVCMYVCSSMYVCMYVCMYACMYVCNFNSKLKHSIQNKINEPGEIHGNLLL